MRITILKWMVLVAVIVTLSLVGMNMLTNAQEQQQQDQKRQDKKEQQQQPARQKQQDQNKQQQPAQQQQQGPGVDTRRRCTHLLHGSV